MNNQHLSILFVPVSGQSGAGEYYRCLAIADALAAAECPAVIHFVISRDAAVTRDERFVYHILDRSPSFESNKVIAIMSQHCPALVIFDSSLRAAQLQAAKRLGANTIGIVSRRGKRRRLLSVRKLRYLDEAWIVGAPQQQRSLTWWERLNCWWWKGSVVFSGAVAVPGSAGILNQLGIPDTYVLIASGGGGGVIKGTSAAEHFARAAEIFATEQGLPVVFVSGPLYAGALPEHEGIRAFRGVSPAEMATLIDHARVCVLGGGSLLLQALAAKALCVAAPAGGADQPTRIHELEAEGLVVADYTTSPERMAALASTLVSRNELRSHLEARVASQESQNGAEALASRIVRILGCH